MKKQENWVMSRKLFVKILEAATPEEAESLINGALHSGLFLVQQEQRFDGFFRSYTLIFANAAALGRFRQTFSEAKHA